MPIGVNAIQGNSKFRTAAGRGVRLRTQTTNIHIFSVFLRKKLKVYKFLFSIMERKQVPHRAGILVYGVAAFASIGGFLFGYVGVIMKEIIHDSSLLMCEIYLFLYINRYDQGVMSGIIVMPYWTNYFNNPNDVMTG